MREFWSERDFFHGTLQEGMQEGEEAKEYTKEKRSTTINIEMCTKYYETASRKVGFK